MKYANVHDFKVQSHLVQPQQYLRFYTLIPPDVCYLHKDCSFCINKVRINFHAAYYLLKVILFNEVGVIILRAEGRVWWIFLQVGERPGSAGQGDLLDRPTRDVAASDTSARAEPSEEPPVSSGGQKRGSQEIDAHGKDQ